MFEHPLFKEDRTEVMHELMHSHPFATMITSQNEEFCADHLPLVLHGDLSERGIIRGHVARGNPLWRNGTSGATALAVFQGPQSYVTPSWYPSKKEHGKAVPTWNYAVVHAHGKLTLIDDGKWLLDHLVELTSRHESHQPVPWEVSDAPDDYMARQVKGIVGFELVIERLEGKWKVSQNKDEEDRAGVQRGLMQERNPDADAVALLVERHGE